MQGSMTDPASNYDDVSINELRQAVEHLHGVPAGYIETVEVDERSRARSRCSTNLVRALLIALAFAMCSIACAGCASSSGAPMQRDAAIVGSADDAAAFTCKAQQDCPYQDGLQVHCCVDGACIYGDQAAATMCTDPNAEFIDASSYDQSCQIDSDCVGVAIGDFCHPNAGCPNAAINKAALPRYKADIAKTYGAGSCTALSSCGFYQGPCCRRGICGMNTDCFGAPSDTLPACADAGGTCGPFITQCGSKGAGPPDSCAYTDEMCCLN
jgi:hypothetical protein